MYGSRRRGVVGGVVVAVVVGGMVSGQVEAEQGSTHGRWRSPEELIQSGQLEAPQVILQVNLRYDVLSNPQLSLRQLSLMHGYAPQPDPLESGYVLSLHAASGDVLGSLTFQIPNVISDPPPQAGEAAEGHPVVLAHLDFALTVPMVDGAVELRITDPQGQVIITESLEQLPVHHNQPNFHSFRQSQRSSDAWPQRLRDGLAWLADHLMETAEAAGNGALDMTFVGDNYTAADLALFYQDVDRAIGHLLTYEPYASRASQLLFHVVENTTVDLGCLHSTAPGSYRLITCNDSTVVSVVNNAGAPYDKIVVLVNDPDYGGSGGAISVSYNGGYEPQVVVHEFGHSFGALLDEYNLYSTNGTLDGKTYANCYAGTPPDASWDGLVALADYAVGCKYPNWYRSSPCSIMLSLSCLSYNAVSQRQINAKLDAYAGPITPTLSLSANPTLIGLSGSSTLSWSASNVTTCTASGAWSGDKPTSGSVVVSPTATSTFTLACTGASGSVTQSVTVTVDSAAPSVSLTSPSSGATVGGTVTVSAAASDNQGVGRVDFYKDGALLGADNTTPFAIDWNTVQEAPGAHTLSAEAVDLAGNSASATPDVVNVVQTADVDAPVATFLNPTAGSTISGKVRIDVSATDNIGVTLLELFIDGSLKTSSTSGSLSASWNVTGRSVKSGAHTLTARALDAVGNVGTVSITVFK